MRADNSPTVGDDDGGNCNCEDSYAMVSHVEVVWHRELKGPTNP